MDFTLIAVVIAAFLAFASNLGMRWWERRQEARSLAAALRGEMITIIDLTNRRGYVELAEQEYLPKLRAGENLAMPRWVDPRITAGDLARYNYPVYSANIGRLGLLGADKSERVSRIYGMWMAVAVDLVNFATGMWDPYPIEAKIHVIEEDLQIWRDSVDLADGVIDDIGRELKS